MQPEESRASHELNYRVNSLVHDNCAIVTADKKGNHETNVIFRNFIEGNQYENQTSEQ